MKYIGHMCEGTLMTKEEKQSQEGGDKKSLRKTLTKVLYHLSALILPGAIVLLGCIISPLNEKKYMRVCLGVFLSVPFYLAIFLFSSLNFRGKSPFFRFGHSYELLVEEKFPLLKSALREQSNSPRSERAANKKDGTTIEKKREKSSTRKVYIEMAWRTFIGKTGKKKFISFFLASVLTTVIACALSCCAFCIFRQCMRTDSVLGDIGRGFAGSLIALSGLTLLFTIHSFFEKSAKLIFMKKRYDKIFVEDMVNAFLSNEKAPDKPLSVQDKALQKLSRLYRLDILPEPQKKSKESSMSDSEESATSDDIDFKEPEHKITLLKTEGYQSYTLKFFSCLFSGILTMLLGYGLSRLADFALPKTDATFFITCSLRVICGMSLLFFLTQLARVASEKLTDKCVKKDNKKEGIQARSKRLEVKDIVLVSGKAVICVVLFVFTLKEIIMPDFAFAESMTEIMSRLCLHEYESFCNLPLIEQTLFGMCIMLVLVVAYGTVIGALDFSEQVARKVLKPKEDHPSPETTNVRETVTTTPEKRLV